MATAKRKRGRSEKNSSALLGDIRAQTQLQMTPADNSLLGILKLMGQLLGLINFSVQFTHLISYRHWRIQGDPLQTHWWIQGGHHQCMPPQQDQFLLFSHTFSPKSVRVGGWHPSNGSVPPLNGKSWICH